MARNIRGITIEIDGNTTKLSASLKNVTTSIKTTQSSLKDVQRLLKLDPSSTVLLQQKQKLLKDAIAGTKEKLDRLKEAQKQAKAQLENGDLGQDQYDALQREIVETEQELKNLKKEAGDCASVLGTQLQEAGSKIKAVGDKVADIGMGLTTKVTAPLAAAGAVVSSKFAEVDKTMQLTNATMKNSAEDAALLNAAMEDAASKSTFGMSDAATATLNFARAGLNAKDAADALAPAMNLAAGEGGNLDTVSAGLVATINGFHGSFDEAGRYADIFASACNNSALDVDSLAESMSVVAPVFSSAGYSVNDAALYMGVMANAGIDANVAANSLKTGLARLVSPAKAGAEKLEELGISVTNADGTMKDSVTIQNELHDAFAGLSESEQIAAASAIFGKNQMSNWLALINTAPDDVISLTADIKGASFSIDSFASQLSANGQSIDDMRDRMEKLGVSSEDFDWFLKTSKGSAELFAEGLLEASESGTSMQDVIDALGGNLDDLQGAMDGTVGTTQEMADAMMNGYGGSIERLKSSLDVLMTSLGRLLSTYLQPVIDKVQAGIDAFMALDDSQKDLIVRIAMIAAAVGPVLLIVGKVIGFIGSIVSGVGTVMTAASTAATFITGTMLPAIGGLVTSLAAVAAPFLPIIAAIGGAIAAGVLLYKNWDTVKEKAGQLVEAAKEKFESFKNAAATKFNEAKEAVAGKVSEIREKVSEELQNTAENAKAKFETLKSNVSSKISAAKDIVSAKASEIQARISDRFADTASTAKEKFEGLRSNVLQKITAAKDAVSNKASAIKESITSRFSESASAAKARFDTLKSNVTNSMSAAASSIKSKADQIRTSIQTSFGNAANAARKKFESLKNGIVDKISSAKDKISGIVSAIKGFFSNMHLSIPKISLPKLPHFSLSGSFSLVPPSVPKLSVQWYAKAMDNGMILDRPTIFGYAGGHYLGAGEAGSETVVGTRSLMDMIRQTNGSGEAARAISTFGAQMLEMMQQYYPQMAQAKVVIGSDGVRAVNRGLQSEATAEGRYR
jgi:TP901 family phage tail tape measure protein